MNIHIMIELLMLILQVIVLAMNFTRFSPDIQTIHLHLNRLARYKKKPVFCMLPPIP